MKIITMWLLAALFLFVPVSASASFYESVEIGRNQTNSLTQQQLDSLNHRTFSDAFLVAKIIGYDPAIIEQLKADVRALQAANAQLKSQLASRPNTSPASASSGLEGRVSALEAQLSSLQSTLQSVVSMLVTLLAKLQ